MSLARPLRHKNSKSNTKSTKESVTDSSANNKQSLESDAQDCGIVVESTGTVLEEKYKRFIAKAKKNGFCPKKLST